MGRDVPIQNYYVPVNMGVCLCMDGDEEVRLYIGAHVYTHIFKDTNVDVIFYLVHG